MTQRALHKPRKDYTLLDAEEFEWWLHACRTSAPDVIADWALYRPRFSKVEYDAGVMVAIRKKNTELLPHLLARANTDEYSMYRRLAALAASEDNARVAALIHAAHVKDSVYFSCNNPSSPWGHGNAHVDFFDLERNDPVHAENRGRFPYDPHLAEHIANGNIYGTQDAQLAEYSCTRGYVIDAWEAVVLNDRVECVKWWKQTLLHCSEVTCAPACIRRQRECGGHKCRFSWQLLLERAEGGGCIERHAVRQLSRRERESVLSSDMGDDDDGSWNAYSSWVYLTVLDAGVSPEMKSQFFAACCRAGNEEMVRPMSLQAGVRVGRHYAALVGVLNDDDDILRILVQRMEAAKAKAATMLKAHWLYRPGGRRACEAKAHFEGGAPDEKAVVRGVANECDFF